MPPKKRTKAQQERYNKSIGKLTCIESELRNKQLVICEIEKELLRLDGEIITKQKVIDSRMMVFNSLQLELLNVNKEIHTKEMRLHRRHLRLSNLNFAYNQSVNADRKYALTISNQVSRKRKGTPFSDELPPRCKKFRRIESVNACMILNGATRENMKPLLLGSLDMITSTFTRVLCKALIKTHKLTEILTETLVPNWIKEYEKSHMNMLRSLNTFYCHNVMGKQKYLNLRKANKKSSYRNVAAPNFVPYAELAKFINNIDIGTLKCVNPDFTYDLEEEEIHPGNYRPCSEYILRLAKFYLCVNESRS